MDDPSLPPSGRDRSRAPGGSTVRFLVIGRILGPVGLGGDLRARILTDFPERLERLTRVYVGDNLRPYDVVSSRLESGTVLLHLAGLDDATTAAALANHDLQIPISEAAELPTDQYYWHQIVGLDVWTDEGAYLGKVVEVLRTGSNDVYVVQNRGRELLLPAIEDVIRSFDLDANRVVVHLLPGLGDDTGA